MKVLFVLSGNGKNGISPIIKSQSNSLISYDSRLSIEFFPIMGKGLNSYLKSSFHLRKVLEKKTFDLIHAHYALSGYVAALTMAKIPKVISIMGSDVYLGFPYSYLNAFFYKKYWNYTIIKSSQLASPLNLRNNYSVIPNGVDLQKFNAINKNEARKKLGLNPDKTYYLFAADPKRKEKNFELAKLSFDSLKGDDAEILVIFEKSQEIMPIYYSAVDVLLFTSYREGSPNVIKEAMACNCPIVTTNVGDVEWVLGDSNGCYITTFEPNDIQEKLRVAAKFAREEGRTKGRERIINLGLDSVTIAQKIISIYEKVIERSY